MNKDGAALYIDDTLLLPNNLFRKYSFVIIFRFNIFRRRFLLCNANGLLLQTRVCFVYVRPAGNGVDAPSAVLLFLATRSRQVLIVRDTLRDHFSHNSPVSTREIN